MTTSPSREIDALDAQCRALGDLLAGLDVREWETPTRCAPLDVRGVTAHLVSQLLHVAELRDATPSAEAPRKDRVSWWDYDVAQDQQIVLDATLDALRELPHGPLAVAFARAAREAVEACRTHAADGDPVFLPGDLPIRLSDYVATRVLEATIHGMDVTDALGREFEPAPEAMAVTGDILRALLGADPRPGVTDRRLAIIGTGRGEPTPRERDALGESLRRFPLLA